MDTIKYIAELYTQKSSENPDFSVLKKIGSYKIPDGLKEQEDELIKDLKLKLTKTFFKMIDNNNYEENDSLKFLEDYIDYIDFEYTDSDRYTALMLACRKGLEKVALELINKFGDKCKPEQINNYGDTALIWACFHGLKKVALELINKFGDKCKPEQINNFGKTALIWACEEGLEKVALELINKFGDKCKPKHVDYEGETVLTYALKNNMDEVVKRLTNRDNKKEVVNDPNKDTIMNIQFKCGDNIITINSTKIMTPEQMVKILKLIKELEE